MSKLKSFSLHVALTASLVLILGAFALTVAWFSGIQPAVAQSAGQVNVVAPLTRDIGAQITLAAEGSKTKNSVDESGFNVTRVVCVYNQTAHAGGTPSTVMNLQNKDAASGSYYTVVSTAAITGDTTPTPLAMGGDITTASNLAAGFPVARTWRVQIVVGGTGTVTTGTVGCSIQ
jgi:hypothetical protein